MSYMQLTNAGVALLQANTGPVVVTSFELGSAYNYMPEPTDTALHGTEVYSGTPSLPLAINANIILYSIYLDYPVGPFTFGEFGLYVGTTLFALGSMSELLTKTPLTSVNPGDSIRIDCYLSVVGENYAMWLNLNQSSNTFRMGIIQSPDYLPPSSTAVPNAYIVQGVNAQQSAFFAYTDTAGLWNFDAYDYAQQAAATITAVDSQSVTIEMSSYVAGMSPSYFGEVLLQFSTGALYGICRYVSTAVISGETVTLGFATPLAMLPQIGDMFQVFGRQILSTQVMNLPPATTTKLGAVIVGPTLTVDATGLLNVNDLMLPVTMVNGQTGEVMLTASDIIDIARVAITGQYSDLLNPPAQYTLMPATTTTLGGVKAPSMAEMHLTIAADGTIDLAFNPVKTVNMQEPDPSTGDVEIMIPTYTGLVNPTALSAYTDLNTMMTTGLYYITSAAVGTIVNLPLGVVTEATLEIVPLTMTGPGDVIQRITTSTQIYFRGLTGSTWSLWGEIAATMTNNEQSILATTMGQATFTTTGYTPGYIEVYLAGLRLIPTVDYTATDGMTITIVNASLAAQVQVGARLTVSAFTVFNVSNAVSAAALFAPTGALLVGYDGTTVGSFLAALQAGTMPGMFTTLALSSTIPSTSISTGALTVVGGVGIEGALNVGSLSSVNLNTEQVSGQSVPPTGAVFRLVNADEVATKLAIDAYVNAGNPNAGVSLRGARGTAVAPMAVQSTDVIGLVAAHGYGATMFQMGSTAVMQFIAEENFTDTSQATAVAWQVTPTGSIIRAEKMRLTSMGVLKLEAGIASTSSTTGTEIITGGLGVSGAVNAGMLSSVNANITPIGGQAAAPAGTLFRVTNVDDTNTKVALDSYNTTSPTSAVIGRGARGTALTPTAVQSTDVIAAFGGIGYGTTMFQPLTTADIRIVAEGAFTDTSQATAVAVMTTPSGSVTKVEVARFTSMGVLKLESNIPSTSTTTGTEVITGGLGVSGAVYAGAIQGPVGSVTPVPVAASTLTAVAGVTLSPTTGTVTIDPSAPGTLDNMIVGGLTPLAVTASTLTAVAQVVTTSMNYQAPTTGSTIQMANTDAILIIAPTGTLATLTVLLPITPLNGQRVKITSTQNINTFTLEPGGAQTVMNVPTSITIPTGGGEVGVEYIYRMTNTTWYRL